MRTIFLFSFIGLFKVHVLSQKSMEEIRFPLQLQDTRISKLMSGDSLIYYQCYLQNFYKNDTIDYSNKRNRGSFKTFTDKLVIIRKQENFYFRYYQSSQHYYPNKKFAYLKLVEKEHWCFQKIKEGCLVLKDVFLLAAIETKLREVTEYDLKVNEKNSPQIILKDRKTANQYRVSGNHLLIKTVNALH